MRRHTCPELLYLETKWASLIPYAKVVNLLQDVLPATETLNQETVRQHLHATATKMEQALGEEQDCLFEGTDDEWAAQPTPDGPMTVGIDGGFVRARRKAGFFEVIAAKPKCMTLGHFSTCCALAPVRPWTGQAPLTPAEAGF